MSDYEELAEVFGLLAKIKDAHRRGTLITDGSEHELLRDLSSVLFRSVEKEREQERRRSDVLDLIEGW